MYTLEYFAPNGEVRKVNMNEYIPEERIGFIVEKAVEFVFPEPGKYFPYWADMGLRYFLLLGYSVDGAIEETMIELNDIMSSQGEVWAKFVEKTNKRQIDCIYESFKRLLEYNLHRPEPDQLRLALTKLVNKIEKYVGSSKFDKLANKLGKTIEDTAKNFVMNISQE